MKLYTEKHDYEKAVNELDTSPALFEHAEIPTDELFEKGMESLLRKIKKETTDYHLSLLGKLTDKNSSKYLYVYFSNIPDEYGFTTFDIFEFHCNNKGNVIANNGRLFGIFNSNEIVSYEISNFECDFYEFYKMYATFRYNEDHTFLEFLQSPYLLESFETIKLIDY